MVIDGSQYIGIFKDDLKSEYGEREWNIGNRYVGEYMDD